jgi:hypothetical protein
MRPITVAKAPKHSNLPKCFLEDKSRMKNHSTKNSTNVSMAFNIVQKDEEKDFEMQSIKDVILPPKKLSRPPLYL